MGTIWNTIRMTKAGRMSASMNRSRSPKPRRRRAAGARALADSAVVGSVIAWDGLFDCRLCRRNPLLGRGIGGGRSPPPRLDSSRDLAHLLAALGQRRLDAVALAGDRLDHVVDAGGEELRPAGEVVGAVDDLLRLDGGGPELPEHGVALDQLLLDFLVGRESARRLPEVDLRLFVQIDPVEQVLGRLLLGGIDVDRNGPRPGVAP